MATIYTNYVDDAEPDKFNILPDPTGPTSSERRCLGAVILSLSLLSVFLLAGLIGLGVHYHGLAAEFSSVKADLSECLQTSLSLTEERDQLNSSLAKEQEEVQRLSEHNHGLAAKLSSVKANLSECLQKSLSLTEERDQLKSTLTEVTKERDELQRLSERKKTCPSGWTLFSGSCYLLSSESGSWDKGREDCRGRGADLVVIDCTEEQTFISGLSLDDIWIGLTDKDKEGVWKWVDGTPLTLSYWYDGEPNDSGGNEDCANIIRSSYTPERDWNDQECSDSLRCICEMKASYDM